MRQLDKIAPKSKDLVIDLVHAAGIDVTDWANYKGGVEKASTNPKYCYEWSFVEPGREVILNLWYANMRERAGVITLSGNLRRSAQVHGQRGGKSVWKKRAERFDEALRIAAWDRLPVRAIINDGTMRKPDDLKAKASWVTRRQLDPMPWAVTTYDNATGQFTLTRGPLVELLADQFIADDDSDSPAERRESTVVTYVRNPAHRERALARARGRCEYCSESGFAKPNGGVFLETHHVVPLSEGGMDSERNVVAICANHHREAHLGAAASVIRQALERRLKRLVKASSRGNRT